MVFLGLRPVMLVYAVITGNMRLAQKIEWKRRHGYVNAWKTILVNFSSFKPSIACKLPIIVYEKLDFVNTGKIVIESNHISRGMLTINPITWRSKSVTRIENHGIITIRQGGIRIFGGGNIMVHNSGNLVFEGYNTCGENLIVYCEKYISIGKKSSMAFNTNVTDSNSHYSVNMKDGSVGYQRKPVVIGDFNWIGNNTSIKPGCRTPHHTIVAASYSVLTKDYTQSLAPYCIIGGCPAKLLKDNVSRVWDVKKEAELLEKASNGENLCIYIDEIEDAITSLNTY